MNLRQRISLVVIGHSLLGCAPGLRPTRCAAERGERAVSTYDALQSFWGGLLTESPALICTDDTRLGCRADVAACTPNPDRIIIQNDQPIDAALAHEALHLVLWSDDPCRSHAEACGWDAVAVEQSTAFAQEQVDATP